MFTGEYRTLYHNATESVRPSGVQRSFITSVRQDSGAGRAGTSPANLAQVSTEYPGGRSPPLLTTPTLSVKVIIESALTSGRCCISLISSQRGKYQRPLPPSRCELTGFFFLPLLPQVNVASGSSSLKMSGMLFVCCSSARSCTFSPG